MTRYALRTIQWKKHQQIVIVLATIADLQSQTTSGQSAMTRHLI